MTHLPLSKLAFLSGLCISSVAAWYSIIGLTALFSGAFWPIVIMGTVLEIGKLVGSAWLFRNWNYAPTFLKVYLTSSVVTLMLITSLGIFGFLSKAHLEHQAESVRASSTMLVLDTRLSQAQSTLQQNEKILQQLIRRWEEAETEKSYEILRSQRKERTLVGKAIIEAQKEIVEVQALRQPLLKNVQQVEAEVGPIKYVAEFLYGDQAGSKLGSAVRGVIVAIVLVFDPLAILLLLAANVQISPQERTTSSEISVPLAQSSANSISHMPKSASATSLSHKVKGPRWTGRFR